MPNTFSQIYIHVIFAVQNRESLIKHDWEEKLYKYITGIVQNKQQKMLSINGMPDHIHFLIGMKPTCNLSDLIRETKKSSNNYIRDSLFSKYKFNWQEGFGAFSHSHSQLGNVIKYINNQKQHHKNKTFKEEYIEFLQKYDVTYEEKYLFKWVD